MLKQNWRIVAGLERIGDNILIIVSFFSSYYLRDTFLFLATLFGLPFPQTLQSLAPMHEYLIVLGISLPMYNAMLSVLGAYRSMRLSSFWELFRRTVLASIVVFLSVGSAMFLLKLDLSRSFVAIFCVFSSLVLLVERYIVLQVLRGFRLRGKNFRNLLIVGTGAQAKSIFAEILKQPELGIRVIGFVSLGNENESVAGIAVNQRNFIFAKQLNSDVLDLPVKIVAGVDDFEVALKRFAIDEVLFTDVATNFGTIEVLANIAVEEGLRVSLAADLFSLEILKSNISYFGSVPLIHYEPTPAEASSLLIKRIIDLTLSSTLLLVMSPLLCAVALAIKSESSGPVFFKQRRVGLNGRIFILLKFRSMVDGAENMLDQLRSRNEMRGPVFKIKHDPRVTRVGKFIRRFSIDELPQLINVLRGDMSLVGPRPPLPEEVSLYLRKQRRRLSMRPGLTCTWQVSGRNEIPDFEKWAKLDLEYIDNWSLINDLKLLVKTIPAVLSGSGAR